MRTLTHFINGRHVEGTSGRFGDVFNPATGQVQAKVPLATAAELAAAVEAARAAQPGWKSRSSATGSAKVASGTAPTRLPA